MVQLPCRVLVWFGSPIEPRRTTYVKGPDVTDPPLEWTSCPASWRRGSDAGTAGTGWSSTSTRCSASGMGTFIDWLPEALVRLDQ